MLPKQNRTHRAGRCLVVQLLIGCLSPSWAGTASSVPMAPVVAVFAVAVVAIGGLAIFAFRTVRACKRLEAELERARVEAEAAAKAKGEFLANISHEIRTPINGIVGMSELVLSTNTSPEQQEYLMTMKSSADALLAILNDIFDFSNIEAGKLALEPVNFSLRDCVADALQLVAVSAREKSIELDCDVALAAPDALFGDAGRLRQVLIHLIGNAVRFTDSGKVLVCAEPATKSEDEEIVLTFSIADTGPGIATGKLLTIFDEFQKAGDAQPGRASGAGLGLTISRRLVLLMKGRIWAESPWRGRPQGLPGPGSVFHFTAAFAPGKEVRPVGLESLQKCRVLMIDQSSRNLDFLASSLSNWGLAPEPAEHVDAAVEALRRAAAAGNGYPLTIISLDGAGDGRAAVERIRKNGGETSIIAITSDTMLSYLLRFGETRVEACLSRPFKLSALASTMVSLAGAKTRKGSHWNANGGSRRLRILLAEDNNVNQKLATKLLEKRGHYVVSVRDGAEAVDTLDRQCFDLILMGVQMPGMDGLEATRTIRAREKVSGVRIPIVAMTAHAMKGDRERCMDAGMDGYIAKPIQADELYALAESIGASADAHRVDV